MSTSTSDAPISGTQHLSRMHTRIRAHVRACMRALASVRVRACGRARAPITSSGARRSVACACSEGRRWLPCAHGGTFTQTAVKAMRQRPTEDDRTGARARERRPAARPPSRAPSFAAIRDCMRRGCAARCANGTALPRAAHVGIRIGRGRRQRLVRERLRPPQERGGQRHPEAEDRAAGSAVGVADDAVAVAAAARVEGRFVDHLRVGLALGGSGPAGLWTGRCVGAGRRWKP